MSAFAHAQRKPTEPASATRASSGLGTTSIPGSQQHETQHDQFSFRRSREESPAHQAANASGSPSPAPVRLNWNFARIPIHPPGLREADDEAGGLPSRPARRTILTQAARSAPGDRLPGSVEEQFAGRFRQDLSHVTIRHDAAASRAVRAIGASAFARGSEIFFAEGAFQPNTASGQALLAHELAHVVQQTGSRNRPSSGQASTSEEYARRASRDQYAGADFLDAGPAAPLSLAADNGVAFEDDAAQQSVLLSDDELADKALDLQAAADKRRESAGGTDLVTGKLDEKALQTVDVARASVARKQKAIARQNRKNRNKKGRKESAPAPSGLNFSPDLSNATDDQVQEHLHDLRKAEILDPDAKQRDRLRREIDLVQGVKSKRANAEAAKRKAQADAMNRRIKDFRNKVKTLEEGAVALNELRKSTSSLVTGPTHFWGGAWTELEASDFVSANVYLTEATDAVKDGNLQYAQYLLGQSASEYYELTTRLGNYTDGIERGGKRVVAVLKVAKTAGRVAASEFDPTGGFLYGSVQDLAGQVSEVAYGQRDSIDYTGIVVDNAINTVVSGVAGYGSSAVSKAASPYLSQLGDSAAWPSRVWSMSPAQPSLPTLRTPRSATT